MVGIGIYPKRLSALLWCSVPNAYLGTEEPGPFRLPATQGKVAIMKANPAADTCMPRHLATAYGGASAIIAPASRSRATAGHCRNWPSLPGLIKILSDRLMITRCHAELSRPSREGW